MGVAENKKAKKTHRGEILFDLIKKRSKEKNYLSKGIDKIQDRYGCELQLDAFNKNQVSFIMPN
jgi:hypothetical protein